MKTQWSHIEISDWRSMLAALFCAVLPVAGGNLIIERIAQHEASAKLDTIVRSALQRAEFALDRAASILQDAASLRLTRCQAADVQALQRLVTASPIVKDITVQNARIGDNACSNLGSIAPPALSTRMTSSQQASIALTTEPIIGPRGKALRIWWEEPNLTRQSALVPTDLILPEQVMFGVAPPYSSVVSFSNGEPVVAVTGRISTARALTASAASQRYPINVAVQSDIGELLANSDSVYTIARAGTGLVGLMGGFLVYFLRRRREQDPVFKMYQALENGEFVPFYQPIMNIRTGRLVGCEVLARWRKPNGEMVPPGAFIELAEQSGFIFPLTTALMRIASQEVGAAYSVRPSLKIAFNLCAEHFRDDKIIEEIGRVFAESYIHPKQIVLEVTERDALPDLDLACDIISRFKQSGIRIALDDVGTGHGGMSYLLKLGIDIMKIDKIFIDGLGRSDNCAAIIDSLVDLARNMHMEVVAEGVESTFQLEELRKRGVAQAQGYLFAKPLAGSAFVQLIETMVPAEAAAIDPVILDDEREKRRAVS